MTKVLCIYHANCADGLGAAWAVHRALGDNAEFVAVKYGETHDLLTPAECVASGNCPSQEDIPRSCPICDGGLGYCKKCHRAEIELDQPCGIPSIKGRDILIVDFSFPLPVLHAMAAEARSVLVLDHHKTAQEDLSGLEPPIELDQELDGLSGYKGWIKWLSNIIGTELHAEENLAAIFDMSRSGAGIAWDYLNQSTNPFHHCDDCTDQDCYQFGCKRYGKTPRPRIIDLIEDRDLWKFKFGDESRAFHAVLTSYDISNLPAMFERMNFWNSWDQGGLGFDSHVLNKGRDILRANRIEVEAAVQATRRTMKIAGHVVPVANVPGSMASEAGELICQPSKTLPPCDVIVKSYDNGDMVAVPLFSATYYDGADGKRHFSLRSPPGGADVSQIARQMAQEFNEIANDKRYIYHKNFYGKTWAGGGHQHAAGFDAPIGWEGEG